MISVSATMNMMDEISSSAEENIKTSAQSGFTALSKFVIANDMRDEVREAFRNRPHLVDDAPGFVRMDVLSPIDNGQEIWLITYWTDEESFRIWHHSHKYHQSHKGIPKGLKLVPKSVEIRYFEHVSS